MTGVRTSAALALGLWLLGAVGVTLAAGPPFPDPQPGVVVYDEAELFSGETKAEAARIIEAIEARTGAEVVVYSQVKPGVSDEEAAADAQALGNAWGVGRAGFDDGLVILFDMETDRQHGAVRLEPGAGFRAAYLGEDESQAIFDGVMLPYLREGNLDLALLAALRAVDAQVTSDDTWKLEAARIANAVLGLVVAPIAALGLLGFLAFRWYRVGRDPHYTDDPSVLMPAPPPGLSPAGATLLMAGRSTERQFTSAMVELAARGDIAFRPEPGLLTTKVAIVEGLGEADPDPYVGLARRTRMEPPEAALLAAIQRRVDAGDGVIEPDEMIGLHGAKGAFDSALERQIAGLGWFRESPSRAIGRWIGIGVLELVLAGLLVFAGFTVPLSGATVLAAALGVAGVATLLVAVVMPARTMAGARLHAWLAAYRRTLQKTLAMAGSMDEVVASRAVPWLETPDKAMVWGVALGLHEEIEAVLARSAASTTAAQAVTGGGVGPWLPGWYGGRSLGDAGGPGGLAPGLFAGSAVPDFGGMFAALSSVGSAASASRSSGGGSGGFGGGGGFSGGGGGGRF
jgi:uncharacterized membrane protein YgcG